ncbi:DgyrCDS2607 [Dimorphilus gyrociliatus]|uniref:POU domain protein n=1 Tax=Dimorphilus gyrociliatus TaxID=2664684 RepID=A0A7I8VDL4_9ANNE|nr:DgyrCDS2607 [Dimorphilus gyrociliatus]
MQTVPRSSMSSYGLYHQTDLFSTGIDANFFPRHDLDLAKAAQHVKGESLQYDMSTTTASGGPRSQMSLHAFGQADTMLEQLSVPMTGFEPPVHSLASHSHPGAGQMVYASPYSGCVQQSPHAAIAAAHTMQSSHTIDCDPRELEAFAERFKQRRIKLGVTQADVGKALGNLKLPGVGSLSQSTICRFESLTLSHNNMIALKPVLAAWLDEAERQARENKQSHEIFSSAADAKRKRTSITAQEKRSLEAYFAVQPRPSGEKIAQIAEKLGLKKNVVRVWFCNQRQKQKRMKFSNLPAHC